jgi:hypothetical protein
MKKMTVDGVEAVQMPGYPRYYVTKGGEVYSTFAKNQHCPPRKKPRKLKKFLNGKKGEEYWTVVICGDGLNKKRKIGWCVLVAWVSPRPLGMVMCHGPKGRLDDSLENLSWGTPKKNLGEDKRRDGTDNRGDRHATRKLNSLQVRIIRHSYVRYNSRGNAVGWKFGLGLKQLAEVFGVSVSVIGRIVNGNSWKCVEGVK